MKIAIIGTGYVGLVTGACLADFGNTVTCLDRDPMKIGALSAGRLPIYEPGLDALVARNARDGRLKLGIIEEGESLTVDDAYVTISTADVIIIAVGTPQAKGSHAPNIDAIAAVARLIGRALRFADASHSPVIMTKSTVPIGSADAIRSIVAEHAAPRAPDTFSVISCPEFLKEGTAVEDFMRPSRIVIGVEPGDDKARAVVTSLFTPLVRERSQIIFMSPRSAELTKYAANGLLATRISFMNELALLADATKANIDDVRLGIGSDPRIGSAFLYAGVGYGGSCFPKDLRALLYAALESNVSLSVVEAADRANECQKRVLGTKIRQALSNTRDKVAIWGLAFKPGTDDIREAPALVIAEDLVNAGVSVTAYDPVAMPNVRMHPIAASQRFALAADPYEAAAGAHALAIVTEWHEFRHPDFARLKSIMGERPTIFDGRNALNAEAARAAGFTYYGIGRP